MSDSLFVITGGGTGAKVAEALIHTCATGIAPRNVHILLIDTDASNGNVQRAASAAKAYNNMSRYPWSVETTAKQSRFAFSGEDVGTQLFTSNVTLYRLTESLNTMISGGLDTAIDPNDDIRHVLELLYNEDERSTRCEDGFRARPNLGCLHLSEHLNKVLKENQEAQEFLTEMAHAASGATQNVPVAVTASVFGGTGASLLPVIRDRIENALKVTQGTTVNTERLTWNAVKVLPHYQPAERKESVDPDRFLLDTASALQFYSKVYRTTEKEIYDGVYVIGSDRPGRNRVEVHLGSRSQSNPSYFEEFVAALAILDAAGEASNPSKQKVRLFMPDGNKPAIKWGDLPQVRSESLQKRFGYLLHLAAFHLREGGTQDFSKGLDRLLREVTPDHLRQLGWYKPVIHKWAKNNSVYSSAGRNEQPDMIQHDTALESLTYDALRGATVEYFGRLMMWAQSALKGEGLDLVHYTTERDYASIHQAMPNLKSGDINKVHQNGTMQQIQPDRDNAMIRTLRAALAAMVRLHNGDVRLKVAVDSFQLVDRNGRISLSVTQPAVENALRNNGLHGVSTSFTGTAM